jgi:hypothetical protein
MTVKIGTAIIVVALIAAWMLRFEPPYTSVTGHLLHRNRITGITCPSTQECWFEVDWSK